MRGPWLFALVAVVLPAVAAAESVPSSRAPGRPAARPPVIKLRPPSPPPPFRPRQATTVLVETSTHELALDQLPSASLAPPPLPGAPPPPPPAPDARRDSTALRLIDASARPAAAPATAPATPAPRGEIADPWSGPRGAVVSTSPAVRIEAVSEGIAALGWDDGLLRQPTLGARCDAPRAGAKPAALRPIAWRQLQPRSDGSFVLREGTAWFDRTGCKLIEGALHESPLRVVAAIEGRPVALAARSGDEVVLVTPPLSDVQQDGGSNPRARPFVTEAGAVTVTRVRPLRGGSLSMAASLAPFVWQQWRAGLGDPAATVVSLPPTVMRFDLSQSLSEPAPLALLTVQRPVGTRESTAPPPPVLGSVVAAEGQRSSGAIADPF